MRYKSFVTLMLVGTPAASNAQGVDCQEILRALTTAPPGVYSPADAQNLANTYNANCLNQPQYQQQYQPPQQQSDADAAADLFGQIIGNAMRR